MGILSNNRRGQSLVEYIMLIAVLSVLTFSILNSAVFKEFFGEESSFFEETRKYLQFTYQHGRPKVGGKINEANYAGARHATYVEGEGDTHFFIPLGATPTQ